MKAAEEWNKEMEDENTKRMISCCVAESLNIFAFNPPSRAITGGHLAAI
jgi:hypothetical protein